MSEPIHIGMNGATVCKASMLLDNRTTTDVAAVTCVDCLWTAMADSLKTTNLVALRIKMLHAEERALLVPARQQS